MAKREGLKREKLEKLYEDYDKKMLELNAVALVEKKQEMLEEMKAERSALLGSIDEDYDLTKQVLVEGLKKMCVLGVIRYH